VPEIRKKGVLGGGGTESNREKERERTRERRITFIERFPKFTNHM